MADITLDGLDFDVADFVGTDGLGHVQVLPSTTGASGAAYPAEARFPNRVFRAALNQLGQGLYSTSTTSLSIGAGSKAFTLASSVQIQKGAFVIATDTANASNWMYGQVTDVTGLVYTVNVTSTNGSGTIASWVFQISGIQGATGTVSDGDKGDITVSGGGGTWTIDNGAVTEAKQTLSDNTTNDVSITKHGYVPKAPNDTTKFLRGDASWAVIPPLGFKHQSGIRYSAANIVNGVPNGTSGMNSDRLYFVPFTVHEAQTYTRILMAVSGANAGNARLGIYNSVAGVPSTLVVDGGAVSTASTGEKEVTISQTLAAGQYFLAIVYNSGGAAAVSYANTTANTLGILGISGFGGVPYTLYYHSHTYGALPSTASSVTPENAPAPWLALKV